MSATQQPEFVVSRTFTAPRQLVWDVFTQAEHLAKWWGPKGFDITVHSLDFRLGGLFHYSMQTPAATMWGRFVYGEIASPERMQFVSSFSDEHAGVTRHPMSATWPLEIFNTWALEEADGKTTLTLRGHPHNASAEENATFAASFESMRMGFGGTLDQLEAYLASLQG